jgi:hypothetical protein
MVCISSIPQHHIKFFLLDLNAKLGTEGILKPKTGNESLYKTSEENGVRVVNFATPKHLTSKSTIFLCDKNHKFT